MLKFPDEPCGAMTPRAFNSCRAVGFTDFFDTIFFFIEWRIPSLARFLRTTHFIPISFLRHVPFINDAMQRFTFGGTTPPDLLKSCFWLTILNIFTGILIVIIGVLLFIAFAAFAILLVLLIARIITETAWILVDGARQQSRSEERHLADETGVWNPIHSKLD